MTKLKIALAQLIPEKGRIEYNIKTAESYIKNAANGDADLIIFPEQYFNGWDPLCCDYSIKEQEKILSALKSAAKDNGIAILGSYYKTSDDIDKIEADDLDECNKESKGSASKKENTSVFIDECGNILAEYSKIHLFSPAGEDRYFAAGNSPTVCTYKDFKFGLTICYDLRFSEIFTYYTAVGCNCVINQSAWPKVRTEHRDILSKARAVENQYYFIGVNIAGETPQDEYFGGSNVIDPCGGKVLQADNREGLYFAEIDSECVDAARQNLPILSDRRDSLYMQWRR